MVSRRSETNLELEDGQRKTLPVAGVLLMLERYRGLGFQGYVKIGVPESKGRQCELSGLHVCEVLCNSKLSRCKHVHKFQGIQFEFTPSSQNLKRHKSSLFNSKSLTARGDAMATMGEVYIKGVYVQ